MGRGRARLRGDSRSEDRDRASPLRSPARGETGLARKARGKSGGARHDLPLPTRDPLEGDPAPRGGRGRGRLRRLEGGWPSSRGGRLGTAASSSSGRRARNPPRTPARPVAEGIEIDQALASRSSPPPRMNEPPNPETDAHLRCSAEVAYRADSTCPCGFPLGGAGLIRCGTSPRRPPRPRGGRCRRSWSSGRTPRRASTPSAQMPPASLPSWPTTPSSAWTTSSTLIWSAGRASV